MSAKASPARLFTLLLGCALLLPACDGGRDPLAVPAPAAAKIVIHGGDNQVAAAGTTLSVPLSVLVTAADGRPVQGVKVRWSVSASSGTVAGLNGSLTDDQGIATAMRTLSGSAGQFTTAAVIEAIGVGVNFTTVSQIQGAYRMLLLPGDVLTLPGDTVLTPLTAPLRVLLQDHEQRPVSGVTVTWSATGGTVPDESSLSDAHGIAEMTFTRGPSAGSQAVRASVQGLGGSPVTFITNTAPGNPVALEKISGDDQAAAVFSALAAPFVVHALDSHGNSVAGVPISWIVAGETVGQSATAAGLPGEARPVALFAHHVGGEQGVHMIHAVASGNAEIAPVSFTYTASAAPPIAVGIFDWYDWYDYCWSCTGSFSPTSVEVLPGQAVVWTWRGSHEHDVVFEDDPAAPVSSALKKTGSHARIFDTPGTYRYRCTAHSSSFTEGMVGTVLVSSHPTDARTLEKVSGDGQVGTVGSALAFPLVVRVADAEGHSVAGVTVSWIADSGTGPVVVGESTTAALTAGELRPVASYHHLLGGDLGVHTVTAAVEGRPDIAPVSFTFTAVATSDATVGVHDWDNSWYWYYCWYYSCGFIPSNVTVSAGRTVTWTWHGTQAHNVVFQDAAAQPVSSAIQTTGTHARTFTTPGVYRYRCTLHSTSFTEGMVGVVVVL